MKKGVLLIGIFLLVTVSSLVFAGDRFLPKRDIGTHVPGEILIGFKPDVTSDQIEAVVSSIGGEIIAKINLPNTKVLRVKIPTTAETAMDGAIHSLKTNPSFAHVIKYVEPNLIQWAHGVSDSSLGAGIMSQSSDPLLSQQWGYYDIGANWMKAPPLVAPVVAVIDTGVDYTHPDLVGKVIKGYDYVNADTDPMDDHGHGTHVAGIIAAKTNNGYGMAGISWNSKILAIKVLNSQGWGTVFDISLGIKYAANSSSVKVINMSLGGPNSSTEQSAVEYAVVTKGKLLVASAGNDGTDDPTNSYPAAFSVTYPSKVLAVAAHDYIEIAPDVWDQCKAPFSNFGTWVSITAPGGAYRPIGEPDPMGILSTVPAYVEERTGFADWQGTSMAAPHVSGAAALAWSKFPTYKNWQIGDLIVTNNSTPYDPLVRDDSCWPNDLSSFQRLSVLHILEGSAFEACDFGGILGFALDAETGEPLAGAKVTTKQGSVITGTDYVSYYGVYTNPLYDSEISEGYGLFLMYTKPTDQYHNLTLQKAKYPTITLPNVYVPDCYGTIVGTIPVPPNKAYYWLAITWNYDYWLAGYDSILDVPVYGPIYWGNPGSLNEAPWTKHLWNSWYGEGNLRTFSEVIRIRKMISGMTYTFYAVDWLNGIGSTSWGDSGIKAYIFRWDPVALRSKLVASFTPPAGSGQFWDICQIKGNTITPINSVSD